MWNNQQARKKINDDYPLTKSATTVEEFSSKLVEAIRQPTKSIFRDVTNDEVFEAAIKSLGSNSRTWISFISKEPELRSLLFNYNPIKVFNEWNDSFKENLKEFFPGQSRKNDINALFQWAKKLTINDNYYKFYIIKLTQQFLEYGENQGFKLNDEQLLLCIAGFCGNPPKIPFFDNYNDYCAESYKFNGMSYILSSEFLRNLGWNGFKPDRHIKRLFNNWFDINTIISFEELHVITRYFNSNQKELIEYIQFSLIGHKITPPELKYSEVDNLLWAFGSYVAKKGRESLYPIQ